jgi:hypothetical protein
MKTYSADYISRGNLFYGTIHIEAEDHKEAMLKFFKWVQTKEVWGHMWKISVELKETEKLETI